MRTFLFSLLIVIQFQLSAEDTIHSTQNFRAQWSLQSDTLLSLHMNTFSSHKYVLKVRGESGAIVWKNQFTSSSFSKKMSLKLLPKLLYTFEVYADGILIASKDLNLSPKINERKVLLKETLWPKPLAEIIEEVNDEVQVQFKNPLLHKMTIVVRGHSGAAVFKTVLRNRESYKGLFSLKQLASGQYTVELFDGNTKIKELRVFVD